MKLLFTALILFFSTACAVAKIDPHARSLAELKPSQIDLHAELSSHEVTSGTIVLMTLKIPSELRKDSISGDFEGISLPIYTALDLGDGVYEAVLGVPYEHKPGPAAITIHLKDNSSEKNIEFPIQVVQGNYPSEVLHVDGRRVNPTKKRDIARILREQAEVKEIYKRITPKKYWSGPFLMPIQSHITSQFGTRRLYNGKLKNYHPGLDLKAPLRTPVYSDAPGEVVLAKNLFFTGNTVMIDHGYGVVTLYAHMSQLKVKKGQVVNSHDLLGLSGQTGRVNGPHLHWQAVVHAVKVNPIGLTQVMR